MPSCNKKFEIPLTKINKNCIIRKIKPANDSYITFSANEDPKLHHFLPDSNQLKSDYELAGVDSGTFESDLSHSLSPASNAVVGIYTSDGTIDSQRDAITCRISLLDSEHEYTSDPNRFHEEKIASEFEGYESESYTEWVERSTKQETVNEHTRTTFMLLRPLLKYSNPEERNIKYPMRLRAFILQSTSWGVIEAGAYVWPDPDPEHILNILSEFIVTIADQCDQFQQPTVDDIWPHLYDHKLNTDELADSMIDTIDSLYHKPDNLKNQPGAVLKNLLDKFQQKHELSRSEARLILDILDKNDVISDSSAGLIEFQ